MSVNIKQNGQLISIAGLNNQINDSSASANTTYSSNKIVDLLSNKADASSIPTKTSDLQNDSDFVADASYVHTDNNFTDSLKSKVDNLGTAATKDVATSGNASSSQVVMGNDTRLTDSRSASDVYDWAKASTKPTYTASEVGLGNVGNYKAVSTVANQGLTDTEKANSRANIGAGTSNFSGAYDDLSGKPTLGTASAKDVPTSGNASTTQVVMGNDTRLSDSRPASDVYSWAKAENKPTYNASEVGAIATTAKGTANGVAELDSTGKVPSAQLPSYVDDVIEGYYYNGKFYKESTHETEISGESGKIYVDLATDKTYRWSGTAFTQIKGDLTLGETSTTAYRGDRGKTAYDHSQTTSGNPHNVTKSDVGLGNVGNFKAVSTEASQGLTDTEKSNARTNIGAGTSSFSGSYNDLSDKPTIPTVNDGVLTIQKNGTDVATFSANQSSNATANIQVVEPDSTIKTNTTGQFNTTTGGKLESCVINIEPKQSGSGTPSPQNVRPISGHTSVEVDVMGKNLFDETYPRISQSIQYKAINVGEGTFTLKTNAPRYDNSGCAVFLLSGNVSSGATNDKHGAYDGNPRTQTATDGYVTIAYRVIADIDPRNYYVFLYDNVTQKTYVIDLGGTYYGGSLDVVSGVLTVDKSVFTITKNTAIDIGAENQFYVSHAITNFVKQISYSTEDIICDKLPTVASNTNVGHNGLGVTGYKDTNNTYPNQNWIYIGTGDSSITTVAQLKIWLESNPLTVCYKLSTPQTIQLTPQQINTLIGENHLYVPLEGQSLDSLSYREMFAWDDVEDIVDERIAKSDIVDNLTTNDATKVLSAKQGKVLQDTKVNISDIKDNLTSTDTNKPLSAKQGKVLDEKIDGLYTEVTDNEPYTLRQGKGDMVDMELVGGSFAWNQLVQNGNFADGTTNLYIQNGTVSVSSNVATMTPTSTNAQLGQDFNNKAIYGHKYFVSVDLKTSGADSTTRISLVLFNTSSGRKYAQKTSSWQTLSAIVTLSDNTQSKWLYVNDARTSNWDAWSIRNFMCIDLTPTSSSIADYIYNLEQATAGSGVAWFRKYFPKLYYAYDAGSIQSVNVASRKVFNSDNNLIAEYPLPTTQLRGIPSLVNNKLVYDGDVLKSDGSVTRKYGIVDLGTFAWGRYNTNISGKYRFVSDRIANTVKKPTSLSNKANIICAKYLTIIGNDPIQNIDGIAIHTNGNVMIYDSNLATATAENFKTAMSGVYLVYELATPTTESALPFQNPQRSDASGTEEFVDYGVSAGTRDVSIPVGHNSTYKSSEVIQPLEDYADGVIEVIPVVSKSANGLCPKLPNESTTTKFLRQDGSWEVPPNDGTTYTAGTNINISEQNVISATDTITEKLYATGSYTSSTSAVTTVTATNSAISISSTTPIDVYSDVFGLNVESISVSGSGTSATISITFPKTESAQTINYRVYVKTI